MKYAVLIIVLSLLSKELSSQLSSGDVVLSLRLHQVQSLVVDFSDNHSMADDDTGGSHNGDYISIFSTSGFEVKVGAVAGEQISVYGDLLNVLYRNPINILRRGSKHYIFWPNFFNARHSLSKDKIVVTNNKDSDGYRVYVEYIDIVKNAAVPNTRDGQSDLTDVDANLFYTMLPK